MQCLLYGSLTPAVSEALIRHGHKTHALAELELSESAGPTDVLKAAALKQWDLVTADAAVAGAPYETEDWFPRSIVYLQLIGGEVEQDDAIDRLFKRYARLTPRRLYTVTENRVKIRQLPGPK
ncbi:MAG: hypothetical protein M3O30_13620 [Planctomycetota bacterium]|nr:hypothetical protein [Planctomycetota bacterium]